MPSIKEDKLLSKNPGLLHSESSIITLSDNNNNSSNNNSSEEKMFSFDKRSKFSTEHFSLQTIIEKPIEFEEKIGFKSFLILKQLGSGSFGKVFLVYFIYLFTKFMFFYKVRKKNDEKLYAMKVLKKKNLILKKQLRYALSEANILKKSDHPFILTLYYSFQVTT